MHRGINSVQTTYVGRIRKPPASLRSLLLNVNSTEVEDHRDHKTAPGRFRFWSWPKEVLSRAKIKRAFCAERGADILPISAPVGYGWGTFPWRVSLPPLPQFAS